MASTKGLNVQVGIAVMVLLAAAGLAICYLGMIQPAHEALNNAKANLVTKQGDLEALQVQQTEYKEVKKESERLARRLDDLSAKIPSTVNELNNFLASISQRARSSRVSKWIVYKPEDKIPQGEVDAVPIRMEFMATYEATIQFFWELASMGDGSTKINNREQLINIKDVSIERSVNNNDEDGILLKVNCVAETYLYTGNVAVAGNP